MPIYAFQCQACGHHFDRLQKLSDADPTDCPVCAQASVTRKLTAPSFRLAGGGWYETDFKKDGKRNLADKGEGGGEKSKDAGGPAAGGDAAKPASTAAATPAAKPDAKPAAPAPSSPKSA
jgi:putative FmdB family regulatory protein